jgi:hypothetical protein
LDLGQYLQKSLLDLINHALICSGSTVLTLE